MSKARGQCEIGDHSVSKLLKFSLYVLKYSMLLPRVCVIKKEVRRYR